MRLILLRRWSPSFSRIFLFWPLDAKPTAAPSADSTRIESKGQAREL